VTGPDYPLPTIPGYELYQLAYVATFVADRLAQYRRARTAEARRAAAQDVVAGRTALAAATGGQVDPHGELPRPLDLQTYNAAAGRVDLTSNRRVNIVDLSELGRDGFAVVAMIPEVGAVGAQVGTDVLAAAIRDHFLTQPAADLLPWKVTEMPPGALDPDDAAVDLVATVRGLDPTTNRDRAVARHLRGHGPQVDAAIAESFAGVDLDAPLTVQPPASGQIPPTPEAGPAAGARGAVAPSAPPTATDAASTASETPATPAASGRPRSWPRRTPRPPDASGGPPTPAP
jgi:hypothetical protein